MIPFDLDAENTDITSHLEDELLRCVWISKRNHCSEAKASEYWSNMNTATEYPKLSAAVEPFLVAFISLDFVEAGASHLNAVLTKERNRLTVEERGNLQLKLTNFQPNVSAFVSDQVHLSPC